MSEIAWFCEKCGFVIADDAGGVRVTHREINDYRAAARPAGTGPATAVDVGDLLCGPAEIRCRPLHYARDPDGGDAYCIDARRIATRDRLAWWTAHLMSKNWLAFTDWDEVLREASGAVPPARLSISRHAA